MRVRVGVLGLAHPAQHEPELARLERVEVTNDDGACADRTWCREVSLGGEPGRSVWAVSLGGQPGRSVWEVSLGGEPHTPSARWAGCSVVVVVGWGGGVLERTSRRTSAHGCPCTRICTTTSRPDEKHGPPEGTWVGLGVAVIGTMIFSVKGKGVRGMGYGVWGMG